MTTTINASTTAGLVQTADTSGVLALQTAGTTAVTVDASQNVGIGTASPSTQLQMNSSAATYSDQLRIRNTNFGNADIGVGSGIMAIATDMSNIAFYTSSNLGTTGSAVPNNERMRIDSSGRVGINATPSTSTTAQLQVTGGNTNATTLATAYSTATAVIVPKSSSGYSLQFGSGPSDVPYIQMSAGGSAAGNMTIQPYGGDLILGTTSPLSSGKFSISFDGSTRQGATLRTTIGTTGSTYMQFENSAGSTAGYIIHNGTTTVSYVTSSDYRLKEAITPMTGALAKVAQLKPVTYKWKVDGSDGEGFIAHELAEVCPTAVTREKDAVDAEGNPQYQGIDTSFLVATLTAAIQEQQALITQLQADVAALKGATP
jgi:hypothetical protein